MTRSKESNKQHGRSEPQFRWQNFRGFRDTGWIRFSKLTVLIGANNSGKSSLLAPLLILKQSLDDPDPKSTLITRGELSNVGSLRDCVYKHELARPLRFAVAFHEHSDKPEGSALSYPPGMIELVFGPSPADDTARLVAFEVRDPYGRICLRRQRRQGGAWSIDGPLATQLRKSKVPAKTLTAIDQEQPHGLLFNGRSVFTSIFDERIVARRPSKRSRSDSSKSKPPEARVNSQAFLYTAICTRVIDELEHLIQRLVYIGPFRDRARRIYEHAGTTPKNVGPRGANAPEMLSQSNELAKVVSKWIRRFMLADGLVCSDVRGSHVFEVKLEHSKNLYNLADSGFGVSQLLPILVQIASNVPGMLIIKQPELHLNPSQQVVLASLFAESVSSDRRLVVETHSEHFLLAIRRMIAERKLSLDDVSLYFVEQGKQGSSARRIGIDSDGGILPSEWPRSFFSEALSESIAYAQARTAAILRNESRAGSDG